MVEMEGLSILDIACVKKNEREEWLTSLTDLRITQRLTTKKLFSDDTLRIFYTWLADRKVFCVEGFPVSVDVIADLVGGLLDMESYFPTLRSIDIYIYGVVMEAWLILQTVKVEFNDQYIHILSQFLSDIIFGVLTEKLRENSLRNLDLTGSYKTHTMIERLLTKHASSLKELSLSMSDETRNLFVSTLLKNEIHLKVLSIKLEEYSSEMMDSLISYLSSAGDFIYYLLA
eukprot:scaffold1206_cov184-Ochromonas_danica.AAC.5